MFYLSQTEEYPKQVNPKGNYSWIFIGKTDAEAETPVIGPPDVKNWLIWKDPDAGKDWRQEEKGMTEDEMVWWHHRLDGHEFEWTLGVGDGQGILACCSPWCHKESDTTEGLNWTDLFSSSPHLISSVLLLLAILIGVQCTETVHCYQYLPLECYICYNWWTCIDTPCSLKDYSLHNGSSCWWQLYNGF